MAEGKEYSPVVKGVGDYVRSELQKRSEAQQVNTSQRQPANEQSQIPTTLEGLANLGKQHQQEGQSQENPPTWFRQVVAKGIDLWFDPKSYESEETYEKVGIRAYKKYAPTTGDLVSRHVWSKFGKPTWVAPGDIGSLKLYEMGTRVYEAIHTGFFTYLAVQTAEDLAAGRIGDAVFKTAMNTFINVYPVMLQRYNRIRLHRAINRMEQRQISRHG